VINRQVVVQLSVDQSPTRVGEFVSNHGVLANVRWEPSGDVEEVRLGGRNHLVTEGSLRHETLLNPDRVRQRLEEQPTAVFVQQLREATRPMNAKNLKDALQQMGLDAQAVASAWTSARKNLATVPGVIQSRDRTPWYRWESDQAHDAEPGASTGTGQLSEAAGSQTTRNSAGVGAELHKEPESQLRKEGPASLADGMDNSAGDNSPLAVHPAGVAAGEGEPSDQSGSDTSPIRGSRDSTPTIHPTVVDVRTLLDRAAADELNEHERDRLEELIVAPNLSPLFRVLHACIFKTTPDAQAVGSLARTPLATARALSGFSAATWLAVAATAQLDESHEVGLLVCCLGKKSQKIDEADIPAAVTDVGVGRLVTRMLIELERMTFDERTDAHLGVSSAAHRIVASSILDSIQTSSLVRLLRCLHLAASRRPAAAELETAVIDAIARRLRQTSGSSGLDDGELAILARAASSLPFTRTGGRSGLLAALSRDFAENLADARWWQGLTSEDLVLAGNGALGHVLTLEAVSKDFVAPLALKTVRAAKSRRELAWVLSVPPTVAGQVPVAEASRVAATIATTDPWMASWLDHIREGQDRRKVEAEREQADSLRGQAEAALVKAQEALQEMESRNERLQSMVAKSHQAAGELRSAQERQVKIDVMRSLAELGAMVAGSAGRLTDDQLVTRVESSLARQSVLPIGNRGSRMRFDPSLHDSSDMGLMSGEQVTVTRSGYTWETGQEAIVLVKAVVDRTGGTNEDE
jgi:hypothetical protein